MIYCENQIVGVGVESPTSTIWFSLDPKRNVSDGVGRNGNVLILLTPIPSRIWLRLRLRFLILIRSLLQLSKANIDSLTVGSTDVAPVSVARNLGAWFYSNLNLQEQIHKTCKSGFFQSIQYLAYPKVSVPGICANFGPCFYHWSYRLLQQPSNGLNSVHLLKLQL